MHQARPYPDELAALAADLHVEMRLEHFVR
jgi:hypothetical protein